jgi:hypothetical protein
MKRNHLFLLAFLVSTLSLIACSGMPKSSGGGGGGNATLSVTLVANPLAPPPATSLLSFSVDVTGLELTPASGTPQNIALNASTYVVDLTKLQSDSAFLGTSATIPVGTYTSVTVGFSNPVLWFCTTSSQTTSGCVPGSVTKVTGGGTAAPITTSLTLAASQQTGLTISFNLANAITINSQGVPVINLAASNVLTAHSLPALSTSLPAGQLDFVEDVTGVVTAFNAAAQTVTVQTATRGSFTATAGTTTVFSPNCTSLNFTCVQQGQVASLDLALAANGTFSLLEYDPLASGAGDWIEGVVTTTPASTTQFQRSGCPIDEQLDRQHRQYPRRRSRAGDPGESEGFHGGYERADRSGNNLRGYGRFDIATRADGGRPCHELHGGIRQHPSRCQCGHLDPALHPGCR